MSDFDLRDQLSLIASEARPVDLYERTIRRSRQLRRRRAISAVATAVVVLAASVATWQLVPRSEAGPVPPGGPASPTVTQTPTPRPVMNAGEFVLTAFTFPDWPGPTEEIGLGECPTGSGIYLNRAYGATEVYLNSTVVEVDVGDAIHSVGSFVCSGPGIGSAGMVLAYRLQGGTLRLVDSIVDTTLSPDEGVWAQIPEIAEGPTSGSIAVTIEAQRTVAGDWRDYEVVRQQRVYTWNGSDYVQTGGLSSFRADPSVDLSVTPGDLVFGPVEGSCRTGRVRLTVTNNGSNPVADVAVMLGVPGLYSPPQFTCPETPQTQGYDSALVPVGTLAPGETRTVFGVVMANPAVGGAVRFNLPPGSYFAEVRAAGGAQWAGDRVPFAVDY